MQQLWIFFPYENMKQIWQQLTERKKIRVFGIIVIIIFIFFYNFESFKYTSIKNKINIILINF
jgi:t-SNARE complex subunit (syntaxin)